MASPPIPAHPLRLRAARSTRTLVLIVLGIFFDVAALINVPGTVEPSSPDDVELTTSGLVTGLTLLVIAAWLTVIGRRRRPWLVMAAGGVLAAIGVSYVLLLVGTFVVIRRHPNRARLIAAVTAAAVALLALREALTSWGAALAWYFTSRLDAQYEPAWIAASFVCAVISLAALAGAVYASQTRAKAQQSDVRAQQEHRRADALTEQMVRQAERERIARDMHDALAHRLSVVSLHAGALEAAASTDHAGSHTGAGDIARTVREQTHAALQDMRGLIGDLRSGDTTPSTSPASMSAVGALLANLRAGGTILHPYVIIESAERAGALFDSAVFRILQEALTNAIKHAPGASIDVHLTVDPSSGARIRVQNALLAGVAPAVPGGGNGTLGIQERAAALGGDAWIGSYEGSFIVDVTLPWQERG